MVHGEAVGQGRCGVLPVSDRLCLRLLEEADAVELYSLIDANRAHLARWLLWAAGQTFLAHAFAVWGLDRVEIRAAVENRRSRAIPERLGFDQERILPEAELVGERSLDLVVYSTGPPGTRR